LTPKGSDNLARGNAPGGKCPRNGSPKGCDTLSFLSETFSLEVKYLATPGVARG
jgi:hypothetical protein